jgi:hypothetical protein
VASAKKLRAMGREDALVWWRGMTEAERKRHTKVVNDGATIRGNLEYDAGFREGWKEITERALKLKEATP